MYSLVKAFQNFSLQIFACSRVDSPGHSIKNLSFHWLELSCTLQDPSTTSLTKWLWQPWAVQTPRGPVPSPGRTAVTYEAQNKHAAHWTGNPEGPSEQTPYLVVEAIRSRKPERQTCPLITGWIGWEVPFYPSWVTAFWSRPMTAVGLSFLCYFSLWAISFYFGQAAMDWRIPLCPQLHSSFWKEPMWSSWRICPQASGRPHLSRSSSMCLPVGVKGRACWTPLAMLCFLPDTPGAPVHRSAHACIPPTSGRLSYLEEWWGAEREFL